MPGPRQLHLVVRRHRSIADHAGPGKSCHDPDACSIDQDPPQRAQDTKDEKWWCHVSSPQQQKREREVQREDEEPAPAAFRRNQLSPQAKGKVEKRQRQGSQDEATSHNDIISGPEDGRGRAVTLGGLSLGRGE
jgi:hypothetical protein